jgi:predicted nuclease of predicted toxin-antitoxin system
VITAAALREYGHDVVWTGDWTDDPGDAAILAIAHQERRILITIDKDFGKLAVLERQPHSGIIRLVNILADEHAPRTQRTLERHGGALEVGAIVTVEMDRTRVRLEGSDDDAERFPHHV